MKFVGKTNPFDPTGDRTETQLKFRRYVHTITLRSPTTADIRGYGRAGFALSTLEGVEKKDLRQHIATALLISTRGAANGLLVSTEDQQDSRELCLIFMKECGGKHDDGAVAMVAQGVMALNMYKGAGPFRVAWQKNNSAYLDSTGSAVPVGMQRRQFLEALRTHAHWTTRNPPRTSEALSGLYSVLITNELTPEQMLGELTIACNALTAFGVDVPAGRKGGTDLVLSAATTQGMRTCDSCNGRGTIELTAHNTSGRYDRRDERDRGGRGDGCGGRDRGRSNYSSWRHGGRGNGHTNDNNRRDEYALSHDAHNYEVRNRSDGRDRANFGNNRRCSRGGRGGRQSERGGHAAFSARGATLFIAHAN